MFSALINVFRIPDLRRKVLFTLAMIFVYRIGAHVPTPFIDPVQMRDFFKGFGGGGGVFAVVDMFSGGAFSQMTIFALGIMPYISASIIIQLLTVVWPRLEKIAKEGEAGRKKINQWTRYGTVALALFQGFGLGVWLLKSNLSLIPGNSATFLFVTAISMAAGTSFIMWLGEKIQSHGIGNGISLIITAGIIARYPVDLGLGLALINSQAMSAMAFIMVIVLMVLMGGFHHLWPGSQPQGSRAARPPHGRAQDDAGRQHVHSAQAEYRRRDPDYLLVFDFEFPVDDPAVFQYEAGCVRLSTEHMVRDEFDSQRLQRFWTRFGRRV